MYYPKKYFRGLSSRKVTQRKREIKKYGSMSSKNPRAYVGFATDKNVKTRPSKYTFKAKSLKDKSRVTGVPLSILKTSYNRGMAAWRTGHRPGANQQQWAYARVNSLLTCGKTHYTADSDLVRRSKTLRSRCL